MEGGLLAESSIDKWSLFYKRRKMQKSKKKIKKRERDIRKAFSSKSFGIEGIFVTRVQ
jgi:hypothetical protein